MKEFMLGQGNTPCNQSSVLNVGQSCGVRCAEGYVDVNGTIECHEENGIPSTTMVCAPKTCQVPVRCVQAHFSLQRTFRCQMCSKNYLLTLNHISHFNANFVVRSTRRTILTA